MTKKKLKVCIGIPVDDGHKGEFWVSLIQFALMAPKIMPKGVEILFKWIMGDSLITRARNNLAHEFLQDTDCEYLMFLDTDLDFRAEDVSRLMQHRLKGVLCGQYSIKQKEHRWCWNALKGHTKPNNKGLMPVSESGTGCMIIHRSVFEAMKKAMPTQFYMDDMRKDKRFSFFDAGVVKGRYMSEDWLFCRRARKLGFPVMIDTQVMLGHYGWARYPLEK